MTEGRGVKMSNLFEVACIEMTRKFSGIRIVDGEYGNSFVPTSWVLTYEITPTEPSEEGIINKGEIAYEKIKFWMDYILDNVILSRQDNEVAINLSYTANNSVVLTPYYPSDSHMVQLLHAKFQSIAGNDLDIGLITLQNLDSNTRCKFSTYDDNYSLPEGDDYMENMYYDTPWWFRNTMDFADFTQEDIDNDPELAEFVHGEDPLVEFERELLKSYSEHSNREPKTAEIIKMPKKWSPKIV